MSERPVLVAAVFMQGLAAVMFGLAFFGLWRVFQRSTAKIWSLAFVVHGVASLLASAVFAMSDPSRPQPALALLALSVNVLLMLAVRAFRWGTEELAGESSGGIVRPLILWGLLGAGMVVIGVGARVAGASDLAFAFQFVVPRVVAALGLLWALAPLLRRRVGPSRLGFRLLALAMALLAVRYVASAVLASASLGAPVPRVDGLALIVAQVSVLIFFGVACSVALVGQERDTALEAATMVRRTAEALMEADARFRFLVENSSDIILLVDADRRVQFVSPSSEPLLGVAPETLVGGDVLDLVHEHDRPRALAEFQRFLATGSPAQVPLGPMRVRHESGRWVSLEARGRVVHAAKEGPRVVLSARDVSLQQELQVAFLRAQRLDSLGQIAARVAHDFNNLLVVVIGAAANARTILGAAHPALADLDQIADAGEKGVDLTRRLLAFARGGPTQVEWFDVGARVTGLEELLERVVGPSVEVALHGGEAECPVRVDPAEFDQVIINLAANARDAMPNGGRMTIRVAGWGSGADRSVRVVVEDTGTGIAPEVLPRVFEPFFSTKPADRGTGLGLASAYGFARQAGGSLGVETTPGQGTRFTLTLPSAGGDEGSGESGPRFA